MLEGDLKERIIELLKRNNYSEILGIARNEQGIFRILVSLTYDKSDLLCWKAIEALGIISGEIAKTSPGIIRNLAGRLLWSIREESGGIGWSAPEMLGEIVRNSPEEFSDIAPIIASFHDEAMLRQAVLRALLRISEVAPHLIDSSAGLVKEYLHDDDAVVRAYALMLAGSLGLREYKSDIKLLLNDGNTVKIYQDGDFRIFTVGQIAGQTVIMFRGGENK